MVAAAWDRGVIRISNERWIVLKDLVAARTCIDSVADSLMLLLTLMGTRKDVLCKE